MSYFYLLQVKFEILLVSPQARGLKEGRTEVKRSLIFYFSFFCFVCFWLFLFVCLSVVVCSFLCQLPF